MRKLVNFLPALLLAGCVTTGAGTKISATLPAVPADVRTCFDELVPPPTAAKMTNQQIVKLIADLRQSELGKSGCGKRLLAFYDSLAGGLK